MRLPRLLYAVDFPPANRGGGDTLLLRLLQTYPADSLFLVTSGRRKQDLASGPFDKHAALLFPEITGSKHHGIAHLWMLLDRLLTPVLALAIAAKIRRWKPGVTLSVAHGYYFLAAAVAARLTGVPFVLIVHDDWVAMNRSIRVFRHFTRPLFGWALRQASQVFAVCPEMQTHLEREYGVGSEVQYPATFPNPRSAAGPIRIPPRIVFAGCIYGNVCGTLDTLVRVVKNHGGMELHLYSQLTQENLRELNWNDPAVHNHGWIAPANLRRALAEADILFLPLSFDGPYAYYSETSFPSKLADYLAAGRPILVAGPSDSSAVRHARAFRYADIATDCTGSALFDALERLLSDGEYRRQLASNAMRAFELHHRIDIQCARFWERLAAVA